MTKPLVATYRPRSKPHVSAIFWDYQAVGGRHTLDDYYHDAREKAEQIMEFIRQYDYTPYYLEVRQTLDTPRIVYDGKASHQTVSPGQYLVLTKDHMGYHHLTTMGNWQFNERYEIVPKEIVRENDDAWTGFVTHLAEQEMAQHLDKDQKAD